MIFATGVEVNQIREQLFTSPRFAFDQNSRLRIGYAQRELDRTTYRGGLTDDSFFTVALVQGTAQVHDFRRQLVAFECGSDLVGDALDERYVVIVETFSRLAPDES